MQSADRFYTSGVKRFMLGSHLSAEEQKNPTLTPQQISHLTREPCSHISSPSSLSLHLFPSGLAVPLQAVPKHSHINQGCPQGDPWVVSPSQGLALAALQHSRGSSSWWGGTGRSCLWPSCTQGKLECLHLMHSESTTVPKEAQNIFSLSS